MSQRSSARGHQRTIIMFDIVPPGLYIKSTSLISPHKGRWQPVHHLSPFAFQWKRWVMWIRVEFCLMSFFYPPKRLKIGRGQLLTPLYFLTPNRKSNANLVWINSHNIAITLPCHCTPNFTALNAWLYLSIHADDCCDGPQWVWKAISESLRAVLCFWWKLLPALKGNIAKLSYTKASNTYNKKHVCSLRCLHF